MNSDGASTPALPDDCELLDALMTELDARLSLLSEGDTFVRDVLRRRLLTKLRAHDRRVAQARSSAKAKLFVAQGGRCGSCGERMAGMRKTRVEPGAPLKCPRCRAISTLDREPSVAGSNEPREAPTFESSAD